MEKTIPNSRFLYESQIVDEIDLARSIGKIDKSIIESTKLQLANHNIIITFNEIPESSEFSKSKIKIGREILGHDGAVFSLYNFKDLDAKKVKYISIVLHSDWKEVFKEAESLVFDVKSWRMLIKDDFSEAFIEI